MDRGGHQGRNHLTMAAGGLPPHTHVLLRFSGIAVAPAAP